MKRLLVLILIIAAGWSASAQITRMEYFWDTDPGFNNGIALPITSADSVSAVFSVSTTGLLPGVHTLYIRSKDAAGKYSVFSKKAIHIQTPVYPIAAAEYFVDTDPGFGNGTAISITPGDSIQLSDIVPTGALAYGIHTIYVRVRDTNGKWSIYGKRMIHIQEPVYPIVAAEYFVDTDPGFGNGTAISITPGDSIELVPAINTTLLTPGIHTVYVRVKNTVGDWSVFSKRLIHIQNPVPPEIVAAEYFVDTDPGLGNGTAISITAGDSVLANFQIPTASLSYGIHMAYVRVKYSNNQWSVFSKKLLYIDNRTDDTIVAAEYFIDTDPGIGSATAISVTPGDSVTANFSAPTGSLLIGAHWIYVRVKDQLNRWTVYSKDSFYVDNFNCSIYGNGEIQMTGDTCRGSQITFKDLTATNSGVNSNDFAREWDIFNDGSVDFTPDSIINYTFNQTGTFTVKLKVYEIAAPICQEIITKTFIIRRIDTTYNNVSICDGQSYFAGGANQTTPNIYYDTYQNIYGCDSVRVTDLTVTPNLPVSVSISISDTNICSGVTAVFTAVPVNGGSSYYTWKVNGGIVGAGNALQGYNPFGISTLTDGDVVTCELTSSETCVSGNPATSNSIVMNVTPSVSASITIAVDTNNYCFGTTATFTVTNVTNEGSNPQYDWYVDNILTQSGGTTFITSTLTGNNVRCYLTSNEVCVNNSPVSSNVIPMNVFQIGFPDVSISPSTNNVCYGTLITFTASNSFGGNNPVYQWFLNDTLVQSGLSNNYSSDTLDDGDETKCVLTSDYQCRLGDFDTSSVVTMDIIYSLPLSVSISESSNNICTGTGVTFTASVTNGGAPNYEWFVNNASVQTGTSFQYGSSALNNNDSIWAVVTSNISCATNNPATSNKIYMTIVQYDTVSVSITATQDTICEGTNVTFTAAAINPGASPTYLWRVNNIQVQSGASNTYSSATLGDGNFVSCELYGDHQCVTPYPAVSNTITMTVYDTLMPFALVSIPQTTICAGTNVSFTATLANEGNNPTIEWMINNNVVQTGGLGFSSSTLQDFDAVRVRLTSSYICPIQNPVLSSPVVMTVLDSITPAVFVFHGPNPACPGNLISVFTTTTTGGASPNFEFKVNGNTVQNGQQTQYTSGSFSNGDIVQVTMTSNASCLRTTTGVSNRDTIIIQSVTAAGVSIQITNQAQCSGDPITFEATPVSGGSNPIYTWRVNNVVFQSGSSNIFTSSALQNGNVVVVEMNSSLSCATNNPAQSNPVDVQFPSSVIPAVSISPSTNNVCQGTSITFTATATNGGANPNYAWKVNGIVAQTDTSNKFITSSLVNGDTVNVEMTSSISCANPSTAKSSAITMILPSSLAPGVTINSSSNSICSGDSVTFTATPSNGGTSPFYQWKINGNNAGINSSTFRTTLNNNDSVSLVMTSSLGCANPTNATSNHIRIAVAAPVIPAVSITANSTTICSGDTVTFTAAPTNGGATPFYQWKVNGNNAGVNSNIFSTTLLSNNDSVHVVMTSNAACVNPASAVSAKIKISVSMPVTPGVNINASATTICNGDSVKFTATPTSGGSAPFYQWKINGNNAGTNSSTFTTILNNNDSVNVVMTSNAGCVNPASVPSNKIRISVSSFTTNSRQVAICAGDSLFVGGSYQTANGTYRDTFTTGSGCDSIIVTQLAIVQNLSSTRTARICSGDSVFAGGAFQHNSGVYFDTLTASGGCDSVLITDLTVSNSFTSNRNVTICSGDSIFAGGKYQTTSGIYFDTTLSASGCDSLLVTALTVLQALPVTNRSVSLCNGDSILAGGHLQYSAGIYFDTLTSYRGCDSIVKTTITVLATSSFSRQITICNKDSIFAGGAFQHTTGIYHDTLTAANGCDSIVTTNLTAVSSFFKSIDAGICVGDSFYAGGAFQQSSGIYRDTLSSVGGCDSIIQTNLSVVSFFFVPVVKNICFGQSFFVGGGNQIFSGFYYDTLTARGGCDSIIQTHLIVNPLPVVDFTGLNSNYCSADLSVTLVGTPPNGSFSGTGIIGNTFNPSIAPVGGPFNVKYTFTDSLDCSNTRTRQVSVALSPTATITGLNIEYCIDHPAVQLTGTPPNGFFAGPGLSNNTFVPYFAGVDTHYISYTVPLSGCDAVHTQAIIIHPLPVVGINNMDNSFCVDAPAVTISTTPTGGILSGVGVIDDEFHPAVAGVGGPHTVIYTYTDSNGCVNQAFHNVIVFGKTNPVFVGLKEDFCLGDLPVVLNALPTGGSFVGAGVSGNILIPDSAGIGLHQLTYFYADANNCRADIVNDFEVHDLPALTLNNLAADYCLHDDAVILDPSPAGGKFSGNGMVVNVFDPLIAGAGGPYIIGYQYTDANGCSNALTQDVTVNPSPIVQISGLNTYYSLEDNLVALTGFPAGGTFIGAGVSGNEFDPSGAGIGYHLIIYSYTDNNGCQSNDKILVQIGAVGIEESLFTGAVNIYPNPFNNELNISLSAIKAVRVKILIRDVIGKTILEKEMETVKGENNFSISFAKMIVDGVYFIELRTKDEVYQEKLIRTE